MPIKVNFNLSDYINDMSDNVEIASNKASEEAAKYLHKDIMRAFKEHGPGWKPLSPITESRKRQNNSKTPTEILREFDVMKDSIEIKNTSRRFLTGVEQKEKIISTKLIGPFKEIKVTTIKNRIKFFWSQVYQRSVGIFSETMKKYNIVNQTGFKGPLNPLSRGIIHEFGGIEKQTKQAGIEEVRTGGIRKKALRGEGEVIKQAKEVTKKQKKFTLSKFVKIPSRSFLRMPMERSIDKMMEIMVKVFNNVFSD